MKFQAAYSLLFISGKSKPSKDEVTKLMKETGVWSFLWYIVIANSLISSLTFLETDLLSSWLPMWLPTVLTRSSAFQAITFVNKPRYRLSPSPKKKRSRRKGRGCRHMWPFHGGHGLRSEGGQIDDLVMNRYGWTVAKALSVLR